MNADQAAPVFIASLAPESRVLDIGSGEDGNGFGGMVRAAGHEYVPFDIRNGDDWEGHIRQGLYGEFDGVYMSHVLEHMLDTHSALVKIHRVLKRNGVLCITVPPLKHQIVGGHVSLWNAGLLLYRLILAGFDCREAAVKGYGYNISVLVRRVPINVPALKYDYGDIGTLAEFFPMEVVHGFNGQFAQVNWRAV